MSSADIKDFSVGTKSILDLWLFFIVLEIKEIFQLDEIYLLFFVTNTDL